MKFWSRVVNCQSSFLLGSTYFKKKKKKSQGLFAISSTFLLCLKKTLVAGLDVE